LIERLPIPVHDSYLAFHSRWRDYSTQVTPHADHKLAPFESRMVTLVNVAACMFTFFLFDIWTETPFLQRVIIQGVQCVLGFGLLVGVALGAAAWRLCGMSLLSLRQRSSHVPYSR
jgi:hypothetical protein